MENNNSVGGGMDNSQASNEANADIKTVKDARAMIAEKNVPRTIKNLNRIFYIFVVLLLAVSGILIYFFTDNRSIQKHMIDAIKVAHTRHSLLAELNFYVRKYQLIGTGVLVYSNMATEEAATKVKIKDLSDSLQQIQFKVVESTHLMVTDINKDTTVKDINNYAITASSADSRSFAIDEISSAYESTLFQYTSETFQVQNSSLADVAATYTTPNKNDTTKNLFKAFEGIFHNGLRYLRSASSVVAKEIYTFNVDFMKNSFKIKTVLISCIGIGLVILGTLLLVPTVFKVMRTTKLVLTLFGMISKEDIQVMCGKCIKYGDQMLVESDRDKKFSDETDLVKKDTQKVSNEKLDGENEADKSKEIPVDKKEGGGDELQVPTGSKGPKKEHEELPFDIKTEKPSLNPQVAVSTFVKQRDVKIGKPIGTGSENSDKNNVNEEEKEKEEEVKDPTGKDLTKTKIAKYADKNKKSGNLKKEADSKLKKQQQKDLKKDSNLE